MAKRITRGRMLESLRGKRLTGAVSKQMGHDRSWLTKTLAGDPDAALSPQMVAQIMDALTACQGKPTA